MLEWPVLEFDDAMSDPCLSLLKEGVLEYTANATEGGPTLNTVPYTFRRWLYTLRKGNADERSSPYTVLARRFLAAAAQEEDAVLSKPCSMFIAAVALLRGGGSATELLQLPEGLSSFVATSIEHETAESEEGLRSRIVTAHDN
eukprot:2932235-Rhodomonas_salina.1